MKLRHGLNTFAVSNLSAVKEEWAYSLLTLVNAFEGRKFLNTLASHPQGYLNICERPSGLLLSSSGSRGERIFVLHDWERIFTRVRTCEVPPYSSACFYSLEHAAGIECFLSYFVHGGELGTYAPSISPAQAFELLSAQGAESLCLTPSTFIRFSNYPRLSEWIHKKIKTISFGGENVPESLKEKLQKYFPHIRCRSVFGTTETMSVRTKMGRDLDWHIPTDPDVLVNPQGSRLVIKTPFLFTHLLQDGRFIPQESEAWDTGDEVEWDNGEFRILRSLHAKFHGVRIFPDEWEKQLLQKFDLPWIQLICESESQLIGIVPKSSESFIPLLKNECRLNAWPVTQWMGEDEMRTTERGKKVWKAWK